MSICISLLELHAAHACNLTCESCSHFSNNGHKGFLSLADADVWMRSWNQRLTPSLFRILGGEPTLHPQLPELLELAAHHWPQSRIGMTTNGFFLHRHPRLPEVLGRHQVILRLTVHHRGEAYLAKVGEILALVNQWRQRHAFEVQIEEAYTRWTRRYHGYGADVLPYEDNQPRKSWENCPCKYCRQLFRGRLWKCSPITYLQVQKETHPGLSPRWDPYLAYGGIGPECSDAELWAFLTRQDEPICTMCAAQPEPFDKPSPLIPLGVVRANSGAR